MIDVDHLRELNATHGHVAGDRALVGVAEALRSATREYDVAARFGGDEFCVLLPETDLDGALVVAERVRVGRRGVDAGRRRPGRRSRSAPSPTAGPACPPSSSWRVADRAAYEAKASGRNAIAAAPPIGPVQEAERLLAEAARRRRDA